MKRQKSENSLQSINKKFHLVVEKHEIGFLKPGKIKCSYVNSDEQAGDTFLKSEMPFQLALRNLNISVFYQDINLRYTWIYNPEIYTTTNPVIGKTDYDIHSQKDADYISNLKNKVLKSGEGHKSLIEIKYNHSRKFFDYNIEPLQSKNGDVIGVGCSAVDITSSIISERKNQNLLREKLDKRISELESFCYSVSHDLRAPLRCIARFSNELMKNYGDSLDEAGEKYLNKIYCNACQMRDLINNLLTFSTLGYQEFNKIYLNIAKIIDEIIDEQQKNMQTPLNYIYRETLFPALGVPFLIRLAFSNLISNAIKFSKNKTNPEITIGSYIIKNEVIYFIKDNGVGFEMKNFNRIFKALNKLQCIDLYEDNGGGLTITKKIINMHGGNIWAESKINAGTTFYVSLPINNY